VRILASSDRAEDTEAGLVELVCAEELLKGSRGALLNFGRGKYFFGKEMNR